MHIEHTLWTRSIKRTKTSHYSTVNDQDLVLNVHRKIVNNHCRFRRNFGITLTDSGEKKVGPYSAKTREIPIANYQKKALPTVLYT